MPSVLERIDPDFRLPYDEEAILSGDPERMASYLLELIKTLNDLIDKIASVANFSIDLVDGAAVYYALKAADQDYSDGTWRRIQVGDNLEDQCKIAGTWVTAQTRERPL